MEEIYRGNEVLEAESYADAEIAAKITELKKESQETIKHNLYTWT